MLSELNPEDAVTQLNNGYRHGGGWNDFNGFTLNRSGTNYSISYPEDPPMRELSRATLRDEVIVLFECSWVAVIQENGKGSYRIARMD